MQSDTKITEATLLNRVMLAVTNAGLRIFRNHVGLGWQGQVHRFSQSRDVRVHPGDVLIQQARPLKAGLCTGSSDLIGWKTVEITAAMVGRKVAAFCALETKSEFGVLSEEQRNFLKQVKDAGGIAIESRDPGSTLLAIREFIG